MIQTLTHFWYTHMPIFSILLPCITAVVLIALDNPNLSPSRRKIRNTVSVLSTLVGLGFAIALVSFAYGGDIRVYNLGEWNAPFGISLVVDRLSALMILITSILAAPLSYYANANWDLRGRYFNSSFHFLLMGVSGAFLTGDLFNLFVFFEVMLIASYVLLLHGQGAQRFQLGVHYVVINLFGSLLFLVGLGIIYGAVGSLNMSDVSRIIPTLSQDQHQLAQVGGLLLFVVFSIKSALLPFGFWLAKTYSVASTPVAAIFAIMTKVGVYSILRVNAGVFTHDVMTQKMLQNWLLPLALITAIFGALIAISASRFRRMAGLLLLNSVGTMLIAIALFTPQAWSAGLYYMIHSTLIIASFYLLSEWIESQRGKDSDLLLVGIQMKQTDLVSIIFFIMAIMVAGLPPFSGFIGKLLILQSSVTSKYGIWVITIILVSSLLTIFALIRTGYVIFWKAKKLPEYDALKNYQELAALPNRPPQRLWLPLAFFLFLLIGLMIAAEPIENYLAKASQQLSNKTLYQKTVLKFDKYDDAISVQPFYPARVPSKTKPSSYQLFNQYLLSEATQLRNPKLIISNEKTQRPTSLKEIK